MSSPFHLELGMLDPAVPLLAVTVVLHNCGDLDGRARYFHVALVGVVASGVVEDRFAACSVHRWLVRALLLLKGHDRLGSARSERFCAHASAKVDDWKSLISCVQFSERQDLGGGPEALSLVVCTVLHGLLDGGLSSGEILWLTQGGVHRYFVMNYTV